MAGAVDEARAAGYTEDEIAAYLAPRVAEAQAAGYSPEDIGRHIGIKPIDHAGAQKNLANRVYDSLVAAGKNTVKALEPAVGAAETSAAVASGFALGFPAYLMGGIGGLIARHTYSPDTDPKEIATMFSHAVTYDPRSDSGKGMTDTVTYPLQLLSAFKERMGKAVADKTGSAPLAAITDETIGMLPFVFLGGLVKSLKGKRPENTDFHTAAKDVAPDGSAKTTKEMADNIQDVYEKTGIDPETVKKRGDARPDRDGGSRIE